jgi:hypothetical protein
MDSTTVIFRPVSIHPLSLSEHHHHHLLSCISPHTSPSTAQYRYLSPGSLSSNSAARRQIKFNETMRKSNWRF